MLAHLLLLLSFLTVTATPPVSLVDAPVSISVHGARPHSRVLVTARTAIFGQPFESHALFVADAVGEVRVDTQTPVSGTYGGVNGMGLFWSMLPAGKARYNGARFDYLAPRSFTITATSNGTRGDRTVTRIVVASGIHFRNIRSPELVGRFYWHDGSSRRPTIIVLGGAEGGIPEDRPAIIASHGFNTLALAYFGAANLPRSLSNIPIEGVKNAIAWLVRQPQVDPSRLAILGGSKGAELGLVAASRFAQIRAVIAFSPSSVVYPGLFYAKSSGPPPSSWSYVGIPLPYVNGTPPQAVEVQIARDVREKRPVSFAPEYLAQLQNAANLGEATIPVERINGPILLVSGDADKLWPSSFMAAQIVNRRRTMRNKFNDVWLRYARAGHEIGEPYYFFADSTLAHLPRFAMALGGNPAANQAASADAWPKIIAFLQRAM